MSEIESTTTSIGNKSFISQNLSSNSLNHSGNRPRWVVGVCCMDSKARSKPMRNILNRLIQTGDFECVIFGDKVILDEDIHSWPSCDFLISLFSTGFPLNKAIDYVKLRKPFLVNDLGTQEILWDRRLVLYLLDSVGVPTPRRLSTYTGTEADLSSSLVEKFKELNLPVPVFPKHPVVSRLIDPDTLQVGEHFMKKPFVEKPISGEDHNIYIYYPQSEGGGVRKLFRKIGNKSSEYYPDISDVRHGSYIYEEFMNVDNAEDVKVYTLGTRCSHAETRKSPVVDGVVRRNAEGKEVRYITELTENEIEIANRVSTAFRQTVCGFDLLRMDGKSYVIDVNGWSFVKGNADYYEKCANVLKEMFFENLHNNPPMLHKELSIENQWRLKGFLSVMRHGDRTPKQKAKFSFQNQVFIDLLNGGFEEVQLKGEDQLSLLKEACNSLLKNNFNNSDKLKQLGRFLDAKSSLPGTKAQIKPSVVDGKITKVQVVLKWGGEFTHGGLHQTKDLAENLRKDLIIINRNVLDDVTVYSSSERRVISTADIFLKTLLMSDLPINDNIIISKEMLDDTNAAKKQIETMKDNFQKMLDPKNSMTLPLGFNTPDHVEPMGVITDIIRILTDLRYNMNKNFENKDLLNEPRRWCCGENSELLRERWDKIFKDFCDVDRSSFEPSRISELYDSLKYDLLHNRDILEISFCDPISGSFEALHSLYYKAKTLFDIVAPNEYGLTKDEKMEIGALSTQGLLKQLMEDLKTTRDGDHPKSYFYFTKESKVISLMNIVLCSGLTSKISQIHELDYLTQIVFELYERKLAESSETDLISGISSKPNCEYSLRLSVSQGAHTSDLIAIQLDAKHSISVQPRRWASDHISLDHVLHKLEDSLKYC